MLVFIEVQIPPAHPLIADHAVGRGELGHDQPASSQVFDEAPEDRVGNASHGGKDGGGTNRDPADLQARRKGPCGADTLVRACAPVARIVPSFLHVALSVSILVGHTIKSPRQRRGLEHPRFRAVAGRNARPTRTYFLAASVFAASPFAASLFAYFRRKRSTRPAVSINFCLPVKNGWHAAQISTLMSPRWVERVTKALPQAQCTRISW